MSEREDDCICAELSNVMGFRLTDEQTKTICDLHTSELDRIRAEVLAPVLALADPEAMGRAMWQVSGLDEGLIDLAAPVAAAALRVAAGTPTHHTTEEDDT